MSGGGGGRHSVCEVCAYFSTLCTSPLVIRATQVRLVPRAVKILKDGASAQDKDEFVHEAEVMLVLRHPNLVQMVGVALQQRPWLSVLELCAYVLPPARLP